MDVDRELEKLRAQRRPRRRPEEEGWLEFLLWELLRGVDVQRIIFYGILLVSLAVSVFARMWAGF